MENFNLTLSGTKYTEAEYLTLSNVIYSNCSTHEILISLIVPTFNRLGLLKEALDSIAHQDKVSFNYEVIIICDDPTNEAIEEFIKSYKFQEFVYHKNKKNLGLFETMNLGVRLARGKWIAFLHDDDMLKNDYLIKIHTLLNKRKSAGAIMVTPKQIGNVTYRSRLRESILYKTLKPIKDRLSVHKSYRLRILDNILWCADQYGAPSCGSVWNREKFLDLGGYNQDTYPSGDWYFMIAFNQKYRVYKTTEQLGYYRWSENASTKPEVIEKFITDNLDLRRYFKDNYILGNIIYYTTKNLHYRHIIDVFLTFDKANTLKPTDFNHIHSYPKWSILYWLYLNGQRAYWVFRVMMSLVLS